MECKEVNISRVYKKVDFVDRGAFGDVFRLLDNDGQVLALKVLQRAQISFPADFARELRCLTRLRGDPFIVRIHKAFLAAGIANTPPSPAFTMDYMPVTLFAMSVGCIVGLPFSVIAKLFRDVARGLMYIHEMGLIHRDLSLRNVLLAANLTAKISDFGVSRQVCSRDMSGGCVTVRYRAPELAMKGTIYGTAADNWSLGTMIMETVENRTVFQPRRGDLDSAELEHETMTNVRRVVDLPGHMSIKAPERYIPNTMRQAAIRKVVLGLLQPTPKLRMTGQDLLDDREWFKLSHINEGDREHATERYRECMMQCTSRLRPI